MLKFLQGLGQTILLVAGVMSVVYALMPDVRKWVETELTARHAHYYVGMFETRPGGVERLQFVQFYSNRWEVDDLIFDERLRDDDEDSFDVFAELPGETLISRPVSSYGPLPGRESWDPLATIETLALADQCFKVDRYACRYPLRDDEGVLRWRTDPGCERTTEAVRSQPDRVHKVALWVRAVRFTCTG